MKFNVIIILFSLAASGYSEVVSDSTKSDYSLFHPTPENLMRSFETDRPDQTESPYTVDAGHFQYETDLFKTDRSEVSGIKTIQNQYNAFNLKSGITNTLDLQLIVESYVTEKVIDRGISAFESGFGNITLRAKQNLWGNDSGKTAMAILPFINIPKNSNSKVTGGVIFPFSFKLPDEWSLGTQFEVDIADNQFNNGYHFNYLTSVTVGHSISGNLSFFAESLIFRENEIKNFKYFFNTGLVYNLNDNIHLDTGVYYGLKKSSSRVLFAGLSFRY